MLKINGDYGEIYIDGRSVSIDSSSVPELEECLITLKGKEKDLIAKQNSLLSAILE